jgi:hypothetical protein
MHRRASGQPVVRRCKQFSKRLRQELDYSSVEPVSWPSQTCPANENPRWFGNGGSFDKSTSGGTEADGAKLAALGGIARTSCQRGLGKVFRIGQARQPWACRH